MKLTDLRPCDKCHGKLLSSHALTWYVVRVTQAMLNPQSVGRTMGLAQFFGAGDATKPGAIALAEAMGDCADDAVMYLGDKEPSLWTEMLICQDCFLRSGTLAQTWSARSEMDGGGEQP